MGGTYAKAWEARSEFDATCRAVDELVPVL
jgi:hypothetical protein